MRQRLDEIVASKVGVEFTYRPEGRPEEVRMVSAGRAASLDLTGGDRRGRYPLSLIDLESS
jgi:hypothetical protein